MLKQTMDFFVSLCFFTNYDYIFVLTKIRVVKNYTTHECLFFANVNLFPRVCYEHYDGLVPSSMAAFTSTLGTSYPSIKSWAWTHYPQSMNEYSTKALEIFPFK